MTDKYQHEMLDFAVEWAPYDGNGDELIFPRFGLPADEFYRRVLRLLDSASARHLSRETMRTIRAQCRESIGAAAERKNAQLETYPTRGSRHERRRCGQVMDESQTIDGSPAVAFRSEKIMADFVAVAILTSLPGAGDELLAHLAQLQGATLDEPKALTYSVVTVREEPRVCILIETFDSAAGFEWHKQNPAVREISEAMAGSIATVDIYTGQTALSG